jgi:outer membrane receptor for ferrienterochelin and colicins
MRLSTLLLFFAAQAFANTAGEIRTYVPADFARYAPQTAYDMVSRVPGFSIKEEDLEERGLGQATGNVVINGQRVSGKSNDVVTELTRIPAQSVQRIEIVEGATLDIPGLSGQVANVIVSSSGISGQFAYRPEFRSYHTDPLFTRFEVSVSGKRGPVEYTLGLENRGNRSGAGGPTAIYSPAGTLMEDRDEVWRGNYDEPKFSGRFVFDGPGSAIGNLNLSYGRVFYDYLETGTRTNSDGVVVNRTVKVEEGGHNYEIGGDYELELGFGRLKLIGVNRSTHSPYETDLLHTDQNELPEIGERFIGTGDTNERIARGEYRWNRAGAEWQLSAEGAFNTLDNTAELFALGSDSRYERVPLPGATSEVSEDRYEVMGSYGRSLTPRVALKFSVGGEYSQLSQAGDSNSTRSFYRPKGEISTSWTPSATTTYNVKLARRVGQLNFYDFLASVDLGDDTQTAANPDLVPQQSWELDVETVRNLGTLGSTTLRAYGHLIDDIIDFIPIGETGEAPGNLDQAVVYGIESRSTFNLDRFGWNGARLDTRWALQDSDVEDPLTGERRNISSSLLRLATIDLRHDVSNTSWAWGGGLIHEYYSLSYRLTEVGRLWEGPVWGNVFIENKDVAGLTIRAGVHNLLAADSMWERTVYEGRRTGPIRYIESRDRTIGPIFSFAIRGKF